MYTTSRALLLMLLVIATAACTGSPPVSESPSGSADPPSSAPDSLLPDGIWEATITSDDIVATGAPSDAAEPGTYRWMFDGSRARIEFDEGGWGCDADAAAAGEAVRLTWHVALNCGGFDELSWTADDEALHLTLVDSSGDPVSTKAILEAAPYQPVEGDATLSWPDAWLTCAEPNRGACLGTLGSGTYTTDAFIPGLTYTVPEGWQNVTDLEGEIVLYPPDQSLDSAHPEYVAVFTSVQAENRECTTEEESIAAQPGVATTPEAIAAEFQHRPGLSTTDPEPVEMGGLSGLVMDITMEEGWTGTCFYYEAPIVQFLGGIQPSDFHHSIEPGQTVRLYLLDADEGSTLAIEIADYADGVDLQTMAKIAESFEFAHR